MKDKFIEIGAIIGGVLGLLFGIVNFEENLLIIAGLTIIGAFCGAKAGEFAFLLLVLIVFFVNLSYNAYRIFNAGDKVIKIYNQSVDKSAGTNREYPTHNSEHISKESQRHQVEPNNRLQVVSKPISILNDCIDSLEVILIYRDSNRKWQTGTWTLKKSKSLLVNELNEDILSSYNNIFIHASYKDSIIISGSERHQMINKQTYGFEKVSFQNKNASYHIPISCDYAFLSSMGFTEEPKASNLSKEQLLYHGELGFENQEKQFVSVENSSSFNISFEIMINDEESSIKKFYLNKFHANEFDHNNLTIGSLFKCRIIETNINTEDFRFILDKWFNLTLEKLPSGDHNLNLTNQLFLDNSILVPREVHISSKETKEQKQKLSISATNRVEISKIFLDRNFTNQSMIDDISKELKAIESNSNQLKEIIFVCPSITNEKYIKAKNIVKKISKGLVDSGINNSKIKIELKAQNYISIFLIKENIKM